MCGEMGLDPSSEADYDRLTELMVNGGGRTRQDFNAEDERESKELLFATFSEAAEWSKSHGGKPFTRSTDGSHFTPAGSASARDTNTNVAPDTPADIRAFLAGQAAAGSDWLPGTYPRGAPGSESDLAEELFARDQLKEKRYFLPRLNVLAPRIAREKLRGKFSTMAFYKLISSAAHQAQSREQLGELLELLEGRLARAKQWYSSQAAGRGEADEVMTKRYKDFPSPSVASGIIMAHERQFGKTPKELSFWLGAVEVVRKELAARNEAGAHASPRAAIEG